MRARAVDENAVASRPCFESTTSRQAVPAKKLRRRRSELAGIASQETDATDWNSLFLRRLEAGELLDQYVAVGTIAPREGSDAGAERSGHRVELFAVRNGDHVGRRVGYIFRLIWLEHL